MPEDGVECESFTIVFINFLLVYENKYYLSAYLDNSPDKIVDKQMIDYLDDSLSQSDENYFDFDK